MLEHIITSYSSETGKGIPLGNLTSQIFANIYLNKLDQFIKHKLKIKYYLRYAGDFIILDYNKENLYQYTSRLDYFLIRNLSLNLHPQKIVLKNLSWGIDFLGYIVLPHYRLPRTRTKRRIVKKIDENLNDLKDGNISEYSFNQSLQSYLGFLKHTNSYKLAQVLKALIL